MPSVKRYSGGKLYESRPAKNGVYYVHWTDDGRSKRQSTGARTVREAQAFLDEWCDLIDCEGTKGRSRGLTCAELWEMKYKDAGERYDAAWANLGPHFGHLKPSQVTAEVEKDYRAKRKVAPSTLRMELAVLRASWNDAVRKKILNANDLHALDPLPPASAPRSRVLSEAEIDRLFRAADHPQRERVRLFLWLALHTAARRTAIQELRWDQVDFDIDVIHYLPDGAVQSRKRKASVPISETLKPVLEEAWRRRLSDTSLVIGSGGKINEPLRLVAEKAGVAGVTPHVMRHTAATIMARNGVSIWVIAQVLGNTVEQVEKVYAKWTPGRHTSAVNVIGRSAA
jgi:integrase